MALVQLFKAKTKVNKGDACSVSRLGSITLVLFVAVCVGWPSFSITKIASGLLKQMKLAEPTDVQLAANHLEKYVSMSFSPVDYLPVLESKLESLSQNPQFMLQVVEQVQADLENASVADDLKFDSVLPVVSSESAEVLALRFVASSGAIVCQSIKQSGHVSSYWNCYSPG